MKIIDISPTISSSMAVFPGDVPYSRKVSLDFKKGDHLLLSSVEMTLHLGAHADAPNHYHPDGVGIDRKNLGEYIGPCQVFHVAAKGFPYRLMPEDLPLEKVRTKRVLLRTGSFPDENVWRDGFTALSPELVAELKKRNVVLVGLDTPSVDPHDSKKLESHNHLYLGQMALLEGLVLAHVPEGTYSLVALPLKIKDGDASPVRAVLLDGVMLPEADGEMKSKS